jgi:VWFA-related protein
MTCTFLPIAYIARHVAPFSRARDDCEGISCHRIGQRSDLIRQFSNNKAVLSGHRTSYPIPYTVRGYGAGGTKMSEFDALQIDSSRSNETVLNFYIRECVVQSKVPKMLPDAQRAIAATCETQARNSARGVLMQAGNITSNTYASLESLMRSSARASGRKLAFFLSDGFLMDVGPHGPNLRGKLDSIIDAAQRAGVVVYTIDARGLVTKHGLLIECAPDTGAVGEISANQDAMNAMAEETGGRALRNQNYFDRWVDKVLDETSNYYLLAWRPDKEEEKTSKFRHVKVTIAGRPDLTIRAPRGYVEGPQPVVAVAGSPATDKTAKGPDADLRAALSDYYPSGALPTLLSLPYLNTPNNETVLTSGIDFRWSDPWRRRQAGCRHQTRGRDPDGQGQNCFQLQEPTKRQSSRRGKI